MKLSIFTPIMFILMLLPSVSVAVPSIGEAAQNILVPTEIVTMLVLIACYILGAILIFMAFSQYKIHQHSPKLVPLTTPILLLILGIISALIPFSSKIFGDSFSALDRAEAERRYKKENVLPLPDVGPSKPMLPIYRDPADPDQGASSTSDESVLPDEPDSGHWTSDPKYNP